LYFQNVNALTIYNGELIAGGEFTLGGGIPVNYIARWNGTSWSALGSGMDYSVFALATFDDGSGPAIYVASDRNDEWPTASLRKYALPAH
jgi:hypothetical protein